MFLVDCKRLDLWINCILGSNRTNQEIVSFECKKNVSTTLHSIIRSTRKYTPILVCFFAIVYLCTVECTVQARFASFIAMCRYGETPHHPSSSGTLPFLSSRLSFFYWGCVITSRHILHIVQSSKKAIN